MKSKIVMAATAFALASILSAQAFAHGHSLSEASAMSAGGSVLASAAVVAVPLSLVIGGSQVVGLSIKQVHDSLSVHTQWTVRGITENADRTVLALQSPDQKATLTVAVPTQQARRTRIALNDTITAERLGAHSFALKHQSTTLGVLTNPQAGLSHSSEKR